MAVSINPRSSDADIAGLVLGMSCMEVDDIIEAKRYTEDEADDADEYEDECDVYEKGDAEDEYETSEESEDGYEIDPGEEYISDPEPKSRRNAYEIREYGVDDYSSQEGLEEECEESEEYEDHGMIVESSPAFYLNESLEQRVNFLNAYLNEGGSWESSTGILVDYTLFVKDAMLRKLVAYWNENIEQLAERGVNGCATLGIVGDRITKSGKKIYAVWLVVSESVGDGDDRVNTMVRKTWIGESILLQFLLVLCHTHVRNGKGEYVNGW